MIKVNAGKQGWTSLIHYHKSEGANSMEHFCDELIVPYLKDSDESIEIDVSDMTVGIGVQMVWIAAFYLTQQCGFDADKVSKQVVFTHRSKGLVSIFAEYNVEFKKGLNKSKEEPQYLS